MYANATITSTACRRSCSQKSWIKRKGHCVDQLACAVSGMPRIEQIVIAVRHQRGWNLQDGGTKALKPCGAEILKGGRRGSVMPVPRQRLPGDNLEGEHRGDIDRDEDKVSRGITRVEVDE